MKRFVLISSNLVKTGGMDRANYALASYLARRGHEVHAVAHDVAQDLLALPNFVFHRVPKPLDSDLIGEHQLSRVGRYWAARLSHAGARVLVNGGNCAWGDVNWVHYVHAAYRPEVCTGVLRQLKAQLSRRVFLGKERSALSRARLVFANSLRTRDDLVRLLDVPAQRIRVVYLGIDPERFRPTTVQDRLAARIRLGWDARQPVMAFIGALSDRRKGFDLLFGAWQELCRGPEWDVKLVVMGLGAEVPRWRRRAQEMGLGKRIEFLGFRRDVPEVLKACDALVAPARYEPYGLGVQEALACGLPALVSASSGIAERFASFAAGLGDLLLPEPLDAASLAVRLRAWREHSAHLVEAIFPLTRALRSYTWDDMAVAMCDAMGL